MRMERALEDDPELAMTAERLGRAIQLLVDDGDSHDPPAALASRTLSLVAQARSRGRGRSFSELVPRRAAFHWADFAVAASIFIAGMLTLVPAIHRSRDRMNQAGCVFNLQQLGKSLAQYASLHPTYPYPPNRQPSAHTGTFAAFLHDAGMLTDLSVLDCPFNGPCPNRAADLPSFEELERIRQTDPARYRRMLCWDYAYNVGHSHGSRGPGPLASRLPMAIPVLADQPAHENYVRILEGNSPNHGRRGQNVLYSDGTIRWHRDRRISPNDPDLYLNNEQEVRPGVHEQDSVLLPSYISFQGQGEQ
jgi:hypothetical protein